MSDISLIVAVSDNNVIGHNGSMPWKMPSDLKRFKNLTSGNCVIMGRKTFDSIGKPLPNRTNVVISRSLPLNILGSPLIFNDLDFVIDLYKIADKEVFIIGGADIYKQSMKYINKIYLTKVHANLEGDTFFEIPLDDSWKLEVKEEIYCKDNKDQYNSTFFIYKKYATNQ